MLAALRHFVCLAAAIVGISAVCGASDTTEIFTAAINILVSIWERVSAAGEPTGITKP